MDTFVPCIFWFLWSWWWFSFLTYTTNQMNQCNFSSSWFGRNALTDGMAAVAYCIGKRCSKKVLQFSDIHFSIQSYLTLWRKNKSGRKECFCFRLLSQGRRCFTAVKVFVVLALDCQFCWKKKDVTKSSPGSSIISNSSIPSKIVILSSQTEYQYTKCSVELKDW